MSTIWNGQQMLAGNSVTTTEINLKAGPVTATFDPEIGFLRQVRLGDHEIIRALYMAVRDKSWKTIPIQLTLTHQRMDQSSFDLGFQVIACRGDIDFRWEGALTGKEDGSLTYSFSGQARTDFERMRIGFCFLHAENECAGKPVIRRTPDGKEEKMCFPALIHPEEPIRDISELEYEAAPGVPILLRFSGDIFEMEDQRNWTDASFKTYSTPASLPRPVKIHAGDEIQQSVSLSFPSPPRRIFPILMGREPQFSIATTPTFTLPPIGLNVPPHQEELSKDKLEWLRALRLNHLRADLLPESPHWTLHLEKAISTAQAVQSKVHLAISASHPGREFLEELAARCAEASVTPAAIQFIGMRGAVLEESAIETVRKECRRLFPGTALAVGSDKDFAQINMNRRLASSQMHPVYGINPQVHAFDNLSLIENITGQVRTVECAQTWWPQPPMIAPIQIHRYPGTRALYQADADKTEWDDRHSSLFAAGWTIGSLAKLATVGHVHSLTYFETSGVRGLIAPSDPNRIPQTFPCIPNSVYPMYFPFLLCSGGGFTRALRTISSHPWETDGFTLIDNVGLRNILIANLTSKDLSIKIKTGTCKTQIRTLSSSNLLESLVNPLEWIKSSPLSTQAAGGKTHVDLPPYAISWIKEDA